MDRKGKVHLSFVFDLAEGLPSGFIGDFYCHKADLVVGVDGELQDLQQGEDARREKVLRELGLRVVRLRNEDVVKNLSTVLEKITEQLN